MFITMQKTFQHVLLHHQLLFRCRRCGHHEVLANIKLIWNIFSSHVLADDILQFAMVRRKDGIQGIEWFANVGGSGSADGILHRNVERYFV